MSNDRNIFPIHTACMDSGFTFCELLVMDKKMTVPSSYYPKRAEFIAMYRKGGYRKLVRLLDETAQTIPMEDKSAADLLSRHDFIVLAYPVQYSNMPVMVREFIKDHSAIWNGKKVLCVATQALFSGDGAGCAARLLRKYGADIVGGLHICMPDSIGDVKLLKKSIVKHREMIRTADQKIEKCAAKIRQGRYPKDGLYFYDRIAGLFGQRLWFYGKTKDYSDRLKINDACTGCGLCARATKYQSSRKAVCKPCTALPFSMICVSRQIPQEKPRI